MRPQFQRGRDLAKIKQITDAIEAVAGAKLMDVDPGADTNRTVVTFVAEPEVALEAAFQAIAKAAQVLDMSQHHGSHPRMGATDVCPFIPVDGLTMEDCAELARRLGKRVGDELGIPVYLYEAAASKPERKNLAFVREGEYEALPRKARTPRGSRTSGPTRSTPRRARRSSAPGNSSSPTTSPSTAETRLTRPTSPSSCGRKAAWPADIRRRRSTVPAKS